MNAIVKYSKSTATYVSSAQPPSPPPPFLHIVSAHIFKFAYV